MEHEDDSDTNCNWCTRYSHQRNGIGTRGLGNKRTSRDHPNYWIIKISQNTKESPGDLKRLAVTQVRNYQLMLVWKTRKRVKAEWINNTTRELEGLEEGPKAEIHTDLLKTTLKKISNRKLPGHEEIHGFWFKKFTTIHDRLALEMNKCLQTAHVPEWMTKGKTTLIQKDPNKGTTPKQLQTHNLPTNDVENINSTNKGRDLLLANKPRFVPWRTERML